MFHHKINVVNAAFSLLEILISLALSSFLLAWVFTSQYSTQYKNLNKQKELLFLQQSAHKIIDYMKPHIEHINFLATQEENSNLYLFKKEKSYFLSSQCLMFIYDVNRDGCIGESHSLCEQSGVNLTNEISKESFGFKVENKEIYYYDGGNKFNHCYAEECSKLLESCDERNWHKVTHLGQFIVDELTFKWIKPEKLLQINLKISSAKEKYLGYSLRSFVYILNNEE